MQLVAPHGWGNPAGRVDNALYSPWRELGVRTGSERRSAAQRAVSFVLGSSMHALSPCVV